MFIKLTAILNNASVYLEVSRIYKILDATESTHTTVHDKSGNVIAVEESARDVMELIAKSRGRLSTIYDILTELP